MKAKSFFAALFLVLAPAAQAAETCSVEKPALDHVIWVVPDLAEGAARFEDLTGIKPVYGGEHTNGVTANYLVSLGPCIYLEIAGPRPGLAREDMGERAETYKTAHIAGFALRVDLGGSLAAAEDILGMKLGSAVNEGGRTKPDGSALAWRTTGLPDINFGPGTFQFVIEWLSDPHPARTSPAGATLVTLEVSGSGAAELIVPSAKFQLPISIDKDAPHDLRLVLDTPKGRVILD